MNPQRTDTEPRLRLQRPVSRFAFIPAIFCAATFMFIALAVIWLGQTSSRVYTEGADALAIRAVLRTNTTQLDAEKLSIRIRDRVPDMTIELINEAMGRSLLALQEPWIAQMPDFEVTPLPILLEMRHPDLLTKPLEVAKFVEELNEEPEVDFVAYNETAHDRLVKLADGAAAIEGHVLMWVLTALALCGFVAQFAFSRMRGSYSLPGLTLFVGATWLAGWAAAALFFRMWETAALATGEWQRINGASYFTVGLAALIIVAAASLLNYVSVRVRP